METPENLENTEIIEEKVSKVASNRPIAFSFTDFFENNRKIVIYGGIGLGVLILAVGGYFYYNSGREAEAQKAMFRAERYYEIDSFRLALKGDGYATGLEDIADEYGGTKAGQNAHYLVGMEKLKEGKYQEAIDHLEAFHIKSPIIYPLALGGIGDAYSQLKDYDAAAKYYIKAATFSENQFTTPRFYKKAGLTYEKLGEYGKAYEAYNKIKGKYEQAREAVDIDKYVARAWAENGYKEE